jgi:hypothetical protein
VDEEQDLFAALRLISSPAGSGPASMDASDHYALGRQKDHSIADLRSYGDTVARLDEEPSLLLGNGFAVSCDLNFQFTRLLDVA